MITPEDLEDMIFNGGLPEKLRAEIHAKTRPGKYKDTIDMIITDLESMVRDQELTEPARARIHALTRKLTMSDEDLKNMALDFGPWYEADIIGALQDLRDRYEERGKYAPYASVQEAKKL